MENLGLPDLKAKLFRAICSAAEEYELEAGRVLNDLRTENRALAADLERIGLRPPATPVTSSADKTPQAGRRASFDNVPGDMRNRLAFSPVNSMDASKISAPDLSRLVEKSFGTNGSTPDLNPAGRRSIGGVPQSPRSPPSALAARRSLPNLQVQAVNRQQVANGVSSNGDGTPKDSNSAENIEKTPNYYSSSGSSDKDQKPVDHTKSIESQQSQVGELVSLSFGPRESRDTQGIQRTQTLPAEMPTMKFTVGSVDGDSDSGSSATVSKRPSMDGYVMPSRSEAGLSLQPAAPARKLTRRVTAPTTSANAKTVPSLADLGNSTASNAGLHPVGRVNSIISNDVVRSQSMMSLQVPGASMQDCEDHAFGQNRAVDRRVSGTSQVSSMVSLMSSNVSANYQACLHDEAGAGLELWPVWRENPHHLRRFSLNANVNMRKPSPSAFGAPTAPRETPSRTTSGPFRASSSIKSSCFTQCRSRVIIHPSSSKRMIWDITGMLLMVYDLIVIPLQTFTPPPTFFTSAMEWVTLLFWSLDMPLSFISGFQVNGAVEMQPGKIALRYFQTWFLFDVMVVAIDWTLTIFDKVLGKDGDQGNLGYVKMGRTARIVRMLRLLRLLRLLKVQGKLSEILELVQSESVRIILGIVKLVICIMLVNHVIACGWFAIGNLEHTDDTWVKFYRIDEKPIPFKYTTSLHWSLTQFTPASMEVNGRNWIERAFTVCILLFAMVTFSSFISSITNATTLLRNLNSDELERRTALFRYLKQHELPMALASDVWSWVLCTKDKSRHRTHEKDVVVLQLLPKSLRIRLKEQVYNPTVSRHPFFSKMYEVNPTGLSKMYAEVMDECAVGVGQELFMTGEVSMNMYFLVNGHMQYSTDISDLEESNFQSCQSRASTSSSNSRARSLRSMNSCAFSELLDWTGNTRVPVKVGQWVSEPVLWVRWTHRGQLAAGTHSELFALSSARFLEFITRDAMEHYEACNYARLFLKFLASNQVSLTDVWCQYDILKALAVEAFDDPGDRKGDSPTILSQSTGAYTTVVPGVVPGSLTINPPRKISDTPRPGPHERYLS